ncbi:MAG: hypothetical protein LBV30_09830 [Propionibacteriaceae bacterium]|jgi:hypothetical protein|nr:hypothetical protein [Propionibacteriaceae bacterium]
MNLFNLLLNHVNAWLPRPADQPRSARQSDSTTNRIKSAGSVTIENVIWAIAVIVIAGIVIAAITAYVNNQADALLGS